MSVSRRALRITAPVRPNVRLDDLDTARAEDLSPAAYIDYVRLSGVDLTGRALDGVVVQDSDWDGVELSDATLREARFGDCRLTGLSATTLRFAKGELRHCEVGRSRFGFADLARAHLRTVRFEGCRFGFLDLSGATVADVVFEDCALDELELSGATAARVAFPGSRVESLALGLESARDLDLRGAEIGTLKGFRSLRGTVLDGAQVVQFAEVLARRLGAHVG